GYLLCQIIFTMKKILWIQTGGTIFCKQTPDGLLPGGNLLLGANRSPEAGIDVTPAVSGVSYDIINPFTLDSTDITPAHWQMLAREVFNNREKYDGFVITHGTDTMQFCAAALSLMLIHFDKPVIFTGSMKPPHLPDSDASANLTAAFEAVRDMKQGVFVAFGGKLIPGISCVKTHTTENDAFTDAGGGFSVVYDNSPPVLRDKLCEKVFYFKITPNVNKDIIDFILEKEYRGVVCEVFGLGGIPRSLLERLGALVKSGVRVIAVSQCLFGSVDFNVYAAHKKAAEIGIEAWDMTGSAALVRLMLELGN
ncbi:MAG: asparaginase, partial [Oscillospiraceae bacterium]|nr:asparaginase [Oscillospiraceae bacterium]